MKYPSEPSGTSYKPRAIIGTGGEEKNSYPEKEWRTSSAPRGMKLPVATRL